jgi:O-antigen ligase
LSATAALPPRHEANVRAAPKLGAAVRVLIEGGVLFVVVLTPWAFGCFPPVYQALLYLAVAVLLALWAVRMLLERRLIWTTCPLGLCLAGLFLLGVWQITPLPHGLLEAVSPETVKLTRQLLPETPDLLPNGRTAEPPRLAAGLAISLYPAGTQAVLLQLLALFAFYALVRSNLAAPAALRRLAVVAVVNGCLLSLFGLLQFFSSPRGFVYWVIPTEAPLFGPLNRNAFAAYVNLCIGLGLGVLLSAAGLVAERSRRVERSRPLALLSQPAVLWTGAALALMMGALALSLSRGGILSFLTASGLCAALMLVPSARRRTGAVLPVALLVIAAGLGLVLWLGYDRVEARLRTLTTKETYEEGRTAVWRRTLPWAKDFPIWGAGYGTFPYLEQLRREPHAGIDYFWDDAHNNYLQLLLEGGAVGLALGLTAVITAFYFAARVFFRPAWPQAGPLAVGAFFALATLALHSFLDFGIHVPATAVLAAALCAHLGSLSRRDARAEVQTTPTPLPLRFAGCLAGAAGVATIALILWQQGSTGWLANRYRGAARAYTAIQDAAAQERRRAYLEAGVATAPQDADLQLALADAYYDTYLRRTAEAEREAVCSAPALGIVASIQQRRDQRRRLRDECLVPALRGYLLARNLCPLLDRPHVRLAAHAADLERTDPVATHLARTRLVVPYSAQIWYLSGLHELEQEAAIHDRTWACWRRSLECSGEYLGEIVRQSRRHLRAEDIAERIVPDDPALLEEAGHLLDRFGDDGGPLYAAALAALERPGAADTPAALLLKARLHRRFGHDDDARRAYEDLLATPGRESAWRLEYARLLFEQSRFQESRRELSLLLDDEPGNSDARELYRQVLQRIAAGG